MVKASLGEDTKAVRLVKNQDTLHAAIEHALSYSDHAIIERYKIAFVNRPVCSSPDSTRHYLSTCQILQIGIFWVTVTRNVDWFYRFIEGREIRCAVLESVKTGKLQTLLCIEYNVFKDDIRKTEVKLQLNEKGLPIGKYSSFFSNFNPYKVRDFIDELQWRLKIRSVVLFISSCYSQSWLDALFLLSAQLGIKQFMWDQTTTPDPGK